MTNRAPNFSDETELAIRAARQAGEKIMEIYRNGFSFSAKDSDGSSVTEADLASNEILSRRLSSLGHPILSEESADDQGRLVAETIWIIDPLDGTADFIRRTVEFAVMIALVQKRRPVIGIIYQPAEDKLFVAERGQGAWLITPGKQQRLRVSRRREFPRVVSSRSHLSDDELAFIAELSPQEHRKMGSAGLKAAVVAAGEADLYFTTTNKIKQWDSAAAHCLINEAGGRMTDMRGGDLIYNTEEVSHRHGLLVTNGLVHDDIIKRYRAFTTSSGTSL